MKNTFLFLVAAAFMLTLVGVIQVPSAHSEPMLKMIAIKADAPGQIHKLARMGIDISEVVKGPMVKGPRGGPVQTYRVEAAIVAFMRALSDGIEPGSSRRAVSSTAC